MVVGVGLGLLAGFVGGKIDAFIMRVCDVQLSFPSILIALLIDGVGRAMFPNAHETLAFGVLILAISLAGWVQYARTVRGSTLVERNKEYVQAARVIGVSPLPHHASARAAQRAWARCWCWPPSRSRAAIITEATLSFLGVGVPPTSAVAGHADPRRQRLPVLRRMVDHDLPGPDAGADRAEREPARRLAARRAEPEAALKHGRQTCDDAARARC